ncbi:MAG: hypothetical protein U0X75_03625 [Acidobacteriota bacterium]
MTAWFTSRATATKAKLRQENVTKGASGLLNGRRSIPSKLRRTMPPPAYFAATLYKADDFRPYLYKTNDYGKTWKKITAGIPDNAFTRVIRADPNRRGLLYAGTETDMYVSFNDGESWHAQLNTYSCPSPTSPFDTTRIWSSARKAVRFGFSMI